MREVRRKQGEKKRTFHERRSHTKPEQHAPICVDTTADTATPPAPNALPPLKLHEWACACVCDLIKSLFTRRSTHKYIPIRLPKYRKICVATGKRRRLYDIKKLRNNFQCALHRLKMASRSQKTTTGNEKGTHPNHPAHSMPVPKAAIGMLEGRYTPSFSSKSARLQARITNEYRKPKGTNRQMKDVGHHSEESK